MSTGTTGRPAHRVPNLDYAPDPVGKEVWKDRSKERVYGLEEMAYRWFFDVHWMSGGNLPNMKAKTYLFVLTIQLRSIPEMLTGLRFHAQEFQ